MAITNTSLGLQKPDGNELLRDGDNVISANAQKIDDLITSDRGRMAAIEAVNTTQDGRLGSLEGQVWFKGYLPNGTDLNTWTDNGRWAIRLASDVATMLNTPAAAGSGFVEMTTSQHGMKVQTWVNYGTNTAWRRTTASIVAGTFTAWGALDVDVKAYADTGDAAGQAYTDGKDTANRAAWAAADTAVAAAATAYTDAEVLKDRNRLTPIEATNTVQDGRLASLEAVSPKVSNIAMDTDGVPYYSPGSTEVHVIPDGDGEPYFITFLSASADTDGAPYF